MCDESTVSGPSARARAVGKPLLEVGLGVRLCAHEGRRGGIERARDLHHDAARRPVHAAGDVQPLLRAAPSWAMTGAPRLPRVIAMTHTRVLVILSSVGEPLE